MTNAAVIAHRGLLQSIPLFGQLAPDEIDAMLASARLVQHRAREMIFAKGSAGDALYAVLAGSVRLSIPAADGREVELGILRPGELFGEVAVLDGGDRTADAIAIADCTLLVVDRAALLAALQRRPDLAMRLLPILCDRLRQATGLVEELLFVDRPTRLARKLMELAAGESEPVRLSVSQRRLGAMVGLSRESINKQMGIWQRQGIVQVAEGAVMIADRAALARIAGRG